MAKFKEIEIKWDAKKVARNKFNQAMCIYLSVYDHHRITVAGFDYYYSTKDGHVARHRQGGTVNELTVKARESNKTTTIRKEINLKLTLDNSALAVQETMFEWGFNKVLPIYKDCDIYVVKDGKYTVDIVWYQVSSPKVKGPDRIFIEVEIHEASTKVSLKMLKKWTKVIESLGITPKDVEKDSLYEIYSGKKYKMSKGK